MDVGVDMLDGKSSSSRQQSRPQSGRPTAAKVPPLNLSKDSTSPKALVVPGQDEKKPQRSASAASLNRLSQPRHKTEKHR